MGEVQFEIHGDYIVRYTPILSVSDMFQQDIVMDKQTFIEAYNKWIKEQEDETNKSNK